MSDRKQLSRRQYLAGIAASSAWLCLPRAFAAQPPPKAQIAITLDLEMSRHYPERGMTEWDYEKGNLDQATKDYSVEAGRIVKERGGVIHYFCVGRVLEQPDTTWLEGLSAAGHPVGNHTYDHVYVLSETATETQYRFQRAPWLVEGRTAEEVIQENIRITTLALADRCGISVNGFRTPGGFSAGLDGREDIQQMLLDEGFSWCSSKYPVHTSGEPMQQPGEDVFADIIRAQSEAQPSVYPTGLIEIPMSPISDVNAFRTHYWPRSSFLHAIGLAVQWAIDNGAMFDLLCHPSCLVIEDPEFETVKLICDLVEQSSDRAEIVGLDAIAGRLASLE